MRERYKTLRVVLPICLPGLGYGYYVNAASMPEQLRHLQIHLQLEQQRFLNFATEAELLHQQSRLSATLKINSTILLAVLAEVKDLMERFATTNGKYEKLAPQEKISWTVYGEVGSATDQLLWRPDEPKADNSKEELTSKSRVVLNHLKKVGGRMNRVGENLRRIVVEPKRLEWATIDKAKFENLLTQLTTWNDYLVSSLDGSKIEQIEKDTSASYLEILELRNDVRSLQELINALSLNERDASTVQKSDNGAIIDRSEAMVIENKKDRARRRYIKQLAEVKKQYILIKVAPGSPLNYSHSDNSDALISRTKRAIEVPTVANENTNGPDASGRQRIAWSNGTTEQKIWVEWLESADDFNPSLHSNKDPFKPIEERIALLTDLLMNQLPYEFLTPHTYGFARQDITGRNPRFGLMFGGQNGQITAENLVTLNELLRKVPQPSLSQRMAVCAAVADSLRGFHSVGWLHKGLRSNNIIYFDSDSKQCDISSCFIAGFQLARPDGMDNFTQSPLRNAYDDLYRHPGVQSWILRTGPYQRCHDIYSLGILLIEVAYWQPIEDVLGLGNVKTIENTTLAGIRKSLLGETATATAGNSFMSTISSNMGDAYAEIVELCLRADEIETSSSGPHSLGQSSPRLQRLLDSSIAEKLATIAQILRSSQAA